MPELLGHCPALGVDGLGECGCCAYPEPLCASEPGMEEPPTLKPLVIECGVDDGPTMGLPGDGALPLLLLIGVEPPLFAGRALPFWFELMNPAPPPSTSVSFA